jgi:glucose/arabinose dehydrogenase
MLFVSTGDSAHTDDLRVRAQDLDSLAGKLLRINPDGTAPEDNPFFTGDPADNRSKVWAYGLREPFRFALQPGTDLPFVGDVGSLYTEEVNIASAGANLGWPCYEGTERPFGIGNHPVCSDLVGQGPDAVTAPIYTYETAPAAAVVAGDFARGYPEPYDAAFFFGDFMNSWIAYLIVDDDGSVTAGERLEIAADNPVSIAASPDGEVYYLSWTEGELRRLRWAPA